MSTPRPEPGREIATTQDGIDITRGYVGPLLLPFDSVLRTRGNYDMQIYEQVLSDEEVKSALNQRMLAVTQCEWDVEPGGKRAIDKAAAEDLKLQLHRIGWDNVTTKMLFGVFYGYAVAEIIYRPDGARVVMDKIKVRNRRRFRFGKDGDLRLLTLNNMSEGVPAALEQIQRAKEILSLVIREGLQPKTSENENDGEEDENVDEDGNPIEKPLPPNVRLRYVDEALAAMGRWRLQQKDCLNQGYILDGFPKNVRQACSMFGQEDVSLPSMEEAKERELEPLPPVELGEATARVDGKLLPDVCIHLYADDSLLLSRTSDAAEDEALPPSSSNSALSSALAHGHVGSLVRRLRQYKANHDPALLADASLLTWVRSATTEEVESNSDNGLVPSVPSRQMFYVEVNAGGLLSEEGQQAGLSYLKVTLGDRHFICPTAQELKAEACEREHLLELQKFKAQRADEKRRADEQLALEKHQREMAVHERRYRSIAEEKKLAEGITTMPMETYLAQYVLHPVAKGVERVITLRPEDPVKALADFLFDYEPRIKL